MPTSKNAQAEMSQDAVPGRHREPHHFCQHREYMGMDEEHFRYRREVKNTSSLIDTEIFSYRTIPRHKRISGPVETFKEFIRYVSRMADRKAAGKDKILVDLFKRAPEDFQR